MCAIPSPLRTRSCKLRRLPDRSGRTTAPRRTSRRAAAATDRHFDRPRGGGSPAGDVGRCNRDPRGSRRDPGKSSGVSWPSRLPARASVTRTRISSSRVKSAEGREIAQGASQGVNYSRGRMQLMALLPSSGEPIDLLSDIKRSPERPSFCGSREYPDGENIR